MIDALGFILNLLAIPTIIKLDEANTKYKSKQADIENAKFQNPCGIVPRTPNDLCSQMWYFDKYVIHKLGSEPYGNAPPIWLEEINELGLRYFGYDITYKLDENGNPTNEKTTAWERMCMARDYFYKQHPGCRWVTIVKDFELRKYQGDEKFLKKCIREFTPDAMKKYDD